MTYLTADDIIAINQSVPGKTGYSILNRGALDEAAGSPARVIYGRELNPLFGNKAAALVFPISQNHPFQDGNKRTAYNALCRFLSLNDYQIIAGYEAEVRDLIGQCAANPPITKEDLGPRLQMRFIRVGATFVQPPRPTAVPAAVVKVSNKFFCSAVFACSDRESRFQPVE